MNQATVLFPGQRLAYHVLDYALEWAHDNEASLQVLFFLPEEVEEEGYPFPNDLDQAEMLKKSFDAEEGLKNILQQEIRYVEKRANARHVPVQCHILVSPGADTIINHTADSEMVFIDRNISELPEAFDNLSFTMEDLRDGITRLFTVSEYDRYSDVVY